MSNKFNIKVKRTYCMHVVAATDRSLVVKVYFRSWTLYCSSATSLSYMQEMLQKP